MNAKEKESELFFHTYKRLAIEVERGEGCYLFTKDEKKYLDMFSGLAVNALGYAHPAIIKAIDEQVRKYTHLSNFFIQEPQLQLAERLLSLSGFDKIFFSNSGTEAIEGTIKLVRKWGKKNGKKNIFGMSNGFSGRTMGALSLMDKDKYRDGYEPFLSNFGTIDFNNVSDLNSQVNEHTSAIFLECIQGEGGIIPVTQEFAESLNLLREKYGFLIVADEIQSGIGRTGKLFGFQHFKIVPDIITVAKPIGGGLPLGAIIGSKKVADVWTYGVHGTTFGGNPVSCAAGVATLDAVMTDSFLKNVNKTSEYFRLKLIDLKSKYSVIKEIRVYGYMIGIELTIESASIVDQMLTKGVLVNSTANTVIRILPPLIAGESEFNILLKILDEVLSSQPKA
ncbi:MAG: acetylornithine/succinylornithine family transaminase [Bacteroidota bacterium]|nr:acetylornithine/succinylornithine family transaminase [Bacteroidota bacterium]